VTTYDTTVAQKYDRFQDSFEALGLNRQYLNYGYKTHRGQSLETCQERLCREVFELANIGPEDTIVDVGFGSGQQDFLLARLYPFRKLIGFNIAQHQVQYANQFAKQKGLQERMVFYHAPAENMSHLEDESVNKVLAIECAFYFDRRRFYQEAARVLIPGGTLVLADIFLGELFNCRARYYGGFFKTGTLGWGRNLWEPFFQTQLIRDISPYTRPGAQKSVITILQFLGKLSVEQRRAWLALAFSSQLVALGLLLKFVVYYLIVLRKLHK
jgi:ubiquinone/menaquinone biosynthesis C-methylase UbiE